MLGRFAPRRLAETDNLEPDGTVTCAIMGIQPADCATADPATVAVIDKARAKAADIITRKCEDGGVEEIHPCEPESTGAAAASCVLDAHQPSPSI